MGFFSCWPLGATFFSCWPLGATEPQSHPKGASVDPQHGEEDDFTGKNNVQKNVYYDIKQEQCQVIFKKYQECLDKKESHECKKFKKILEKCNLIKNN